MNYTAGQIFDERIGMMWGALNIKHSRMLLMDELMIDYYFWRIAE